MERPMATDEVFDLIQSHVGRANDLGMTIILSALDEEGAQAQFIPIGGDDEMDFLINQDSAESHLVGNTMGERNVFYVAPTLNNQPIYVYLPASSPSPDSQPLNEDEPSSENSEFDDLWSYPDHRHNAGENMLQFSSLYDRRPPHVDPAIYKPQIYIPTILERDGDLVITAEYNPDPNSDSDHRYNDSGAERRKRSISEDRNKETVIFVNGVEDYERLHVKLFSIFYEIDWSWARLQQNPNQTTNETEETQLFQGSRVWKLRPQELHFPQAPLSGPDCQMMKKMRILTRNLQLPDSNLYNKFTSPGGESQDEDGDLPGGSSVILVGMKKAIEVNNVTLTFILTDPSNSTQNETIFQLTPENITTALPDVATAQEEFTGAHELFENVVAQLTLVKDNFQSDFDTNTNASEGVEVAQMDFMSHFSNFTRYFDAVNELEGGFVWIHRNHGKALRGVRRRERDFNEAYSNVVSAYNSFTEAEQSYNSSRADFTIAKEAIEVEGNDFQLSYENLQLALQQLTDSKENFSKSAEEFWGALLIVNESETNFLLSYEGYTAVLEEVRVGAAKCARRKVVFTVG